MPKVCFGVTLYSLREFAEELDITYLTAANYANKGILRTTLIGRTRYVTEQDAKVFTLGVRFNDLPTEYDESEQEETNQQGEPAEPTGDLPPTPNYAPLHVESLEPQPPAVPSDLKPTEKAKAPKLSKGKAMTKEQPKG